MQKETKKSIIATNISEEIIKMLDEEAKRIDSPRSYIVRKIIYDYFDSKQKEGA